MSARAKIKLKTKLAATLCQLVRYDDTIAEFVKVIPYDEAKRLTEDQVLSRFEFHHDPIPKAHGGKDVHYNLVPLPAAEHDKITAEITIPAIAKSKRIIKREAGVKKPRTMTRWRKFDGSIVHADRDRS